jgi:gamma-glutamyltranspeptidase
MIYVEHSGFLTTSIDSLVAMGHKVTVWGYKTEVDAIARSDSGWVGVADPRRSGAAAGY